MVKLTPTDIKKIEDAINSGHVQEVCVKREKRETENGREEGIVLLLVKKKKL